MRVTQKLLQQMVEDLNESAGFRTPAKSASECEGRYFLDMAYAGYKLSQYIGTSRACREISRNGYGTARQLYDFLCVYVHPTN